MFFSLSQVWVLLAEGIVKEADKLACLVLFFTVPVTQYCKGTHSMRHVQMFPVHLHYL